jgi:hypothetical protein
MEKARTGRSGIRRVAGATARQDAIALWGIDEMVRRITAAALATIVFACGSAHAQTAAPAAADVRVGDRWSYDVKDDATGDLRNSITVVVVDVTEKEINTRIAVKGKEGQPPRPFIFAHDWGRIDDSVWQFQPSEIGIKLPLKMGKEWRGEVSAKNLKTGSSLRGSGTAKVVSEEKVTTGAGTYDTFKVDIMVRQVNTNDQTKTSTSKIAVWYAPAVNRWVKKSTEIRFEGRLRNSFTEELTAYSRKP